MFPTHCTPVPDFQDHNGSKARSKFPLADRSTQTKSPFPPVLLSRFPAGSAYFLHKSAPHPPGPAAYCHLASFHPGSVLLLRCYLSGLPFLHTRQLPPADRALRPDNTSLHPNTLPPLSVSFSHILPVQIIHTTHRLLLPAAAA